MLSSSVLYRLVCCYASRGTAYASVRPFRCPAASGGNEGAATRPFQSRRDRTRISGPNAAPDPKHQAIVWAALSSTQEMGMVSPDSRCAEHTGLAGQGAPLGTAFCQEPRASWTGSRRVDKMPQSGILSFTNRWIGDDPASHC